ncbi:MAG: hypothetical protein EYC70_08780 [Planctomycetota bacterium]|nr:MAG: hypothetical protein EYC70_08780 [Planctomycetota bacterium]
MRILLTPILLAAAAAAAPSQQLYETISSETFEYAAGSPLGALNGGHGWSAEWFSGATNDNCLVSSPGFDADGEKATTVVDGGGSWRTMSVASYESLLDNGLFGKDGTTFWVSFWCQRTAGGDDDYGGLSLYIRFGGEMLFIGSPSFTEEWGVHDVRFHPAPYTVPGTDCDTLARLVCRIDFLPGSERARLWIDPTDPHPTTTPDLDVLLDDFRFNEIRLQSGNSVTTTGFHFDGVAIDTPAFRPIMSVDNPVAGQVARLNVVNCAPGNNVVIAYSINGPGPVNSPYGTVHLTPPINQLMPIPADAQGEVHLNVTVPPGLSGRTVWAQSLEVTGPGAGNLSNPLAVSIQ